MTVFVALSAVFVVVVVLLVTHAETGLSVALIGVIAAVLTVLAAGGDILHLLRKTDWRTLVFLIGLFIVVGGLEETGVLAVLADGIASLSGDSLATVLIIILWLSGFASALVDNIPFAATMVPVISGLSASQGLALPPMAWALALGTDIGGNATPIGASANVVGTAMCEREGYHVGWGRYMKQALPPTIIVLVICTLFLLFRY
jgi:Na+/H+ antiporter NhaD/arsenite permease-like protein